MVSDAFGLPQQLANRKLQKARKRNKSHQVVVMHERYTFLKLNTNSNSYSNRNKNKNKNINLDKNIHFETKSAALPIIPKIAPPKESKHATRRSSGAIGIGHTDDQVNTVIGSLVHMITHPKTTRWILLYWNLVMVIAIQIHQAKTEMVKQENTRFCIITSCWQ